MCLEAFKYALNKEIYYEIIQQWYIHRYTVGGESVRDQLNLFLYLLLNLCGCFDIQRLEKELPFLKTAGGCGAATGGRQAEMGGEMPEMLIEEVGQEEEEAESDEVENVKMRRTRSEKEGGESDWEFLVGDEAFKGLEEFNIGEMRASVMKCSAVVAPMQYNANLNKMKVERVSVGFSVSIFGFNFWGQT